MIRSARGKDGRTDERVEQYHSQLSFLACRSTCLLMIQTWGWIAGFGLTGSVAMDGSSCASVVYINTSSTVLIRHSFVQLPAVNQSFPSLLPLLPPFSPSPTLLLWTVFRSQIAPCHLATRGTQGFAGMDHRGRREGRANRSHSYSSCFLFVYRHVH